MRALSLICALLIVLFGVSFSILNASLVTVNYYFGMFEMPLSLLLVLTLFIGGLLGVIACLLMVLRKGCEIRNLRKKMKLVEEELANLRSLPLQNEH